MEEFSKRRRTLSQFAAPLTNALACLWASVAAYILWQSPLSTHNLRFSLAALPALVAAWATLERKRWGRMALMGLGLTTVLAFAFLLGAFAAFPDHVEPEVRSLSNHLHALAALYDIKMPAVVGLLFLAAATVFWMLHPHVISEFNRNKKPALAVGQRVIAIALVCWWAAAIPLSPLMTAEQQGRTRRTPPLLAEQQSEARSKALRAGPRRANSPRYDPQTLSSLPVLSAPPARSR